MPEIRTRTIIDVINDLDSKIYLPAIQLDFVWKPEQIEMLFDSLLKDYPLGTLLFWKIPEQYEKDFLLYKFINEFEAEKSINEQLPEPKSNPHDVTAVLDGQQRLTAFFIGLKGSYTFNKRGSKEAKKRFLYLNLLYPYYLKTNMDVKLESDEIQKGGFRFLTEEEARENDGETCWYKVHDIAMSNPNDSNFNPIIKSVIKQATPELKAEYETDDKFGIMINNLAQTHARLLSKTLLSINELTEKMTLDEVTEIFVRVNSGGTKLAKTDLMFSMVATAWKESRKEFKDLIKELDFKGFDNDFIMRCCLAICLKNPSIKAGQLTPIKISQIKEKWSGIKKAIKECTGLLQEWGFDSDRIIGTNAIIPIVFCIYAVHEKQIDKLNKSFKDELRKSFIAIMLTARFSQGTDKEVPRLIKAMETVLKNNSLNLFSFQKVSDAYAEINDIDKSKELAITQESIEELLATPKSSPKAFILLSILDPKYNPIFQLHVDHMHPKSSFNKNELDKLGVSAEKIKEWKEKREQLPNLQILVGITNQIKNDTPLAEWIATEYSTDDDQNKYLSEKGLVGCSLDLKDFDLFFETRKSFLRNKLAEYFGINY